MFTVFQSKNQKVNLSLINMLQYPGVRLSNTDNRRRSGKDMKYMVAVRIPVRVINFSCFAA
jgi:hypothetical protein